MKRLFKGIAILGIIYVLISPLITKASNNNDSSKYANQRTKFTYFSDRVTSFDISSDENPVRIKFIDDEGDSYVSYPDKKYEPVELGDSLSLNMTGYVDPMNADNNITLLDIPNVVEVIKTASGTIVVNGSAIIGAKEAVPVDYSGPIELVLYRDSPYNFAISTQTGGIYIEDFNDIGKVDASSITGDIVISNIGSAHEITADTLSGDIILQDVYSASSINAESKTGDINLYGTDSQNMNVQTDGEIVR